MCLKQHYKNFLAIFIVICFSVYSGSPLAGYVQPKSTGSAKGAVEQSAVKIYLIHLLLTSMFDDGSDDAPSEQEDPADDLYLIKKKRVVYSAKKVLPIFSPITIANIAPDADQTKNIHRSLPAFFLPKVSTVQYLIVPHHSGNAPPSA